MVHAGVKDVRDLLDSSSYFVIYNAFITKNNIETNYIEHYKAVSALIKTGKMFPHLKPHSPRKNAAENLQFATKTYQIIFKRKTSSPVKSQEKWLSEDIFPNVQVNWEKKTISYHFYVIRKK